MVPIDDGSSVLRRDGCVRDEGFDILAELLKLCMCVLEGFHSARPL